MPRHIPEGTIDKAVDFALAALNLLPDPFGGTVVDVVNKIWSSVQRAKQNKHQIEELFRRVCYILGSVQVSQSYSDNAMQSSVKMLIGSLESVLAFVEQEQRKSFIRGVFAGDDIRMKIEEHERNIWTACLSFQNASLLTANKKLDELWEMLHTQQNQQSQQAAYLSDINEKLELMRKAVSSESPVFIDTLLDTVNADPMKMMTAMQAVLEREETADKLKPEERAFFRVGVKRLREQTNGQIGEIKIKSWTVTGFEVERGYLLGEDLTSTVRMGRWAERLVGILEVKDEATVKGLIKSWKHLRNSRIQTFVGGSTVDSPPFILLPYAGDNIITYIKRAHKPVYMKLARDILRGLCYLHEKQPPSIHGGLRPATVFVDEKDVAQLGSVGVRPSDLAEPPPRDLFLPWIAPELQSTYGSGDEILTIASDIYSLGRLFLAMVEVCPTDPTTVDAREALKMLAERCLVEDPEKRPTAFGLLSEIDKKEDMDGNPFLPLMSLYDLDGVATLEEASKWRVMPASRHQYGVVIHKHDAIYLITSPINGKGEHPVRMISFEIRCHDQGAEATTANPRDGIWTWFEVALLRKNSEDESWRAIDFEAAEPEQFRGHMVDSHRFEVLRLPFADSTPRTHRVNWGPHHLVTRLAAKGDTIALFPKARYPGWHCHVYSAEIDVICEFE